MTNYVDLVFMYLFAIFIFVFFGEIKWWSSFLKNWVFFFVVLKQS